MDDVEWKPLPEGLWPEGAVFADLPGVIVEVFCEDGVPTWKVIRANGRGKMAKEIVSGTADSVEAAKAAAIHEAGLVIRSK